MLFSYKVYFLAKYDREIVQLVKYLLFKHKFLCLTFRDNVKMLSVVVPALRRQRQVGPGAHQPVRPVRDCLNKVDGT